jgi:hypothetical protein
MKISISQFVEQITGIVKYEYSDSGHFQGMIKLINNPAAFKISVENLATRGAYL